MKTLDTVIAEVLESGEPCVLVTVTNQDGSAPRAAGSRMIVRRDGSIAGTIGGGAVEGMAMRTAAEALLAGECLQRVYDLSGTAGSGMDMICGGRMEVLFEPLLPTEAMRAMFTALEGDGPSTRGGFFLVLLEPGTLDAARFSRCLVLPGPAGSAPRVLGGWNPPQPMLDAFMARAKRRFAPFLAEEGGARVLVEPRACPGDVYLFGAGHISLEMAILAKRLGFRVVVMDDRPEFANSARFPGVDRVFVPPSFDASLPLEELTGESLDEDSYVVIVTRGHRYDKTLLGQALRTRAGYIGMIGSRSKRGEVYRALALEGFPETAFARVHCPIGLDIGAQTPQEIAVSIVAELIAVRAGKSAS